MKKIVNIHIAKTAGTSTNKFFVEHFRDRSLTHCESIWNTPEFKNKLADSDYVAGHKKFSELYNVLGHDCYYITFFRDPSKHLYSHLNWIRDLAKPENKARYDSHPNVIQKIADRLILFDLTQADDLESLFTSLTPPERGFFDNCQSRYFCNPTNDKVSFQDFENIIRNINRLQFIGITETQNDSISALADIFEIPFSKKVYHENKNTSNLPYSKLSSDTITALKHYSLVDELVYEYAKRISNKDLSGRQVALPVTLKDQTVDFLRGIALAQESIDMKISLEIMKIALHYRPNGPLLQKKVMEYNQKIRS